MSVAPFAGPASEDEVDRLRAEIAWLSRRCRSHEVTLGHLAEALRTLRAGGQALREENRLLRGELARLRTAPKDER